MFINFSSSNYRPIYSTSTSDNAHDGTHFGAKVTLTGRVARKKLSSEQKRQNHIESESRRREFFKKKKEVREQFCTSKGVDLKTLMPKDSEIHTRTAITPAHGQRLTKDQKRQNHNNSEANRRTKLYAYYRALADKAKELGYESESNSGWPGKLAGQGQPLITKMDNSRSNSVHTAQEKIVSPSADSKSANRSSRAMSINSEDAEGEIDDTDHSLTPTSSRTITPNSPVIPPSENLNSFEPGNPFGFEYTGFHSLEGEYASSENSTLKNDTIPWRDHIKNMPPAMQNWIAWCFEPHSTLR